MAPIRAQKTLGLSLPKAHEVGRKLEDLFHDFDQLLGYVFHVFFPCSKHCHHEALYLLPAHAATCDSVTAGIADPSLGIARPADD